jgi:hypothetical protein
LFARAKFLITQVFFCGAFLEIRKSRLYTVLTEDPVKTLLATMFSTMIFLLLAVTLVGADNTTIVIGDHILPLSPSAIGKSHGLTNGVVDQSSAGTSLTAPSTVFRDVPSINGHYSVGGHTFLPYVGAGFGSGYATDLDRSLHNPSPTTMDPGLRNQLGQSITPNEFQMGIRIPF